MKYHLYTDVHRNVQEHKHVKEIGPEAPKDLPEKVKNIKDSKKNKETVKMTRYREKLENEMKSIYKKEMIFHRYIFRKYKIF